jgi:hypothetical protein
MSDRIQNRIPLSEFERLLADDSTPDETLARYLKPAETRGRPMAPAFTVDETKVEVPPSRGIFSVAVGILNERGERQRIKAYQQRIAAGWRGLKLLAEGDSWFLYPVLLKDVVDWLDADYAIYSVAAAGDTLDNMLSGIDRLESLIAKHKFDGFLFSGGGNDIAGEPLVGYLVAAAAAQKTPDPYVGAAFDTFLAKAEKQYDLLFRRLTTLFPDLRIFCHGYDWPFPRQDGSWLWPAMVSRSVPEGLRAGVLRLMIDRFYRSLMKVAANYKSRVTVIDCRGVVGPVAEWYDELHPNDSGFSRVAARFRAAIAEQFPGRIATRGATRALKLSWHPHEDRTGARVQTKVIAAGATVTLGRHADREIMLDDDRVSRNHALLVAGEQDAVIEDLGSTNGTILEGKRITRAVWKPGQEVRIGNFKLNLEAVTVDAATVAVPMGGPSGTPPLAPPLAPAQAPLEQASAGAASAPAKQLLRLAIELACGSIVNIAAPAYVVGIFHHIRPTASRGPAREIDKLIGERLSALVQSGMFGSDVGQISTLPVPEKELKTDILAFAGLGAITSFAPPALAVAGANLIRVLAAAKIPGFATVPIGTNTGCSMADFVANFMKGVVHGLAETGSEGAPSKITICELDEGRYAELAAELKKLAATGLFRDSGVELTLSESNVGRAGRGGAGEDRGVVNQTLVHATLDGGGQYQYYTLPMSGAGLPVWTQAVDTAKLAELTRVIDADTTSFGPTIGASLAALFLPAAVQDMLAGRLGEPDSHLLVIHDRGASSIPWEALYFNGLCPALESGVSRKCLVRSTRASHGPLPRDSLLRMLIVYPHYSSAGGLAPLPGAEEEGAMLAQLFKANRGEVTILSGKDAAKQRILGELKAGGHTILHYAGHAWFSKEDPRQSGLLLNEGEGITAADLEDESSALKLVFLNACESTRMRGAKPSSGLGLRSRIEASGGLAEGLLSIGVANLVGTYWEVDDAAAKLFAHDFYGSLLKGDAMSAALRAARRAVKEQGRAGNRMWANYLHFGDPTDKLRSAGATAS